MVGKDSTGGESRSGDEDFEYDAACDEAGEESIGNGDRYDASLGDSPAVPVGPAGAVDQVDQLAADLGALFAAALAEEPPSTVTAESVLREARAKGSGRSVLGAAGRWFASGSASLKWSGGLVAAAALVGTIVVVAPMMHGGSGTASSAGGVAGAMYSSAADGSAGAVSESSSASAAAVEAAPEAGTAEMPASSSSSEAASDAGGNSVLSAADSGDTSSEGSDSGGSPLAAAAAGSASSDAPADTVGGAERSTEASSPGTSESAAGSASSAVPPGSAPGTTSPGGSIACSAPPLTDAEWAAVFRSLSENDVLRERYAAGCDTQARRAGFVQFNSSRSAIEVLIGSVDQYPSGLAPSLGDQQLGETVTARSSGTIVVVAASANIGTQVSHTQLVQLAQSVLTAAG